MKTILILDDEKTVRESFSDYFEDRLWLPIQAETGEQAIKILKKTNIDAAVVDVRLPGMDGNEFIRRAYRLKQGIVFVICTGSPEYVVPQDLLGFPCVSNRIFKKPVTNIAELEEELHQRMAQLENGGFHGQNKKS